MFRSLWRYRAFVIASIRNELITRFARSTLGGLWIILQPLLQVLIYTLILSAVLRTKLTGIENRYAYAIYLTAGMLGWSLFNEIINRCLSIFIEHANLIKKMQFPKTTLPTIVAGSAMLNNVMLLIAIIFIFAMIGHMPTVHLVWLPIVSLIMVMFSIGLGLIFGIINVFIRDIGQVVPIFLQIMFWFTPIVYPLDVIPEDYRYLIMLNPLFAIVSSYQKVLAKGLAPELVQLMLVGFFSIGMLLLALFLFRRASAEMVDVL